MYRNLFSGALLFLFLVLPLKGFSQEEASIWYFGEYAGLDFSSGSPVNLNASAMYAGEGCSSISDENGNLLFYTNGEEVYNQNHQIMQNGDDLRGSTSASQAAIIIPKPGSDYIYYIFTTNSYDGGAMENGLNFYEVNMLSDGGLGSVVSVNGASLDLPLTPLATPVSEKLTAVYSYDGENVWVVAHGSGPDNGQDFLTYKVTENGVNTTPIISSVGSTYSADSWDVNAGCMKISPDGTKLAVAMTGSDGEGGLELFDFDNTTGMVSNAKHINSLSNYGVEFSPNSSILYATNSNGTGNPGNAHEISQYDVSSNDLTTIQDSQISVGSGNIGILTSLQLGIDGKLYCAIAFGTHYLHVINQPNNLGTACDFQAGAIELGDNASFNGLPNYITSYFNEFRDQHQLYECSGDDLELTTGYPEHISFVWERMNPETGLYESIQFGSDVESIVVHEENPGSYTYRLTSYDSLGNAIEELFFVLFSAHPEIDLGPDIALCGSNSVILDATPLSSGNEGFGQFYYTWYQGGDIIPNEEGSTLIVTSPGIYSVEVSGSILNQNGNEIDPLLVCSAQETIQVTDSNFTVSLGSDQALCDVGSADLMADLDGADPENATYLWSGPNGDLSQTTQTITVTESGTYHIEVQVGNCTASADVQVDFQTSPVFDLGPDLVLCDLDGVVLNADPTNFDASEVHFTWSYNGNTIPESGSQVNAADYGFGIYTVNEYKDETCKSESSINLTEQNIEINLTADKPLSEELRYCKDDGEIPSYTITFKAIVPDSLSGLSFKWFKDNEIIQGETTSTYVVVFSEPGEYTSNYTVEGTIGNCAVQTSKEVNIIIAPFETPCKITQGLSPNGDGANDCLDLAFLHDRSGIAKFELFNRYGVKVYEKNNYIDSWCGQDNNGNKLKTGTYYYILEMKTEDPVFGKQKRGWIYINRQH